MSQLLQAIPDLQTLIIRMRMLESLNKHYLNVHQNRLPDPDNVLQARRICQDLLREIDTLQEQLTKKQIQNSRHDNSSYLQLNLNSLEPREEPREEPDALISGVQMVESINRVQVNMPLPREQKDQQVQVNQPEESIWPKLQFQWSCCFCFG